MGRKIFISYKYADYLVQNISYIGENTKVRDYVDVIQERIGKENINKGENDGEDMSSLADSTIQSKLGDKIYDSSITIVVISPGMREAYKREDEQWIPWEISYSLREQSRNRRCSKTNAMLAVILPDVYGRYDYYMTTKTCPFCNTRITTYHTDKLFKMLSSNMFNIKSPTLSDCSHETGKSYLGECSYISSVKWCDFYGNEEYYLLKAERIKEHIDDYNIKVNINS